MRLVGSIPAGVFRLHGQLVRNLAKLADRIRCCPMVKIEGERPIQSPLLEISEIGAKNRQPSFQGQM